MLPYARRNTIESEGTERPFDVYENFWICGVVHPALCAAKLNLPMARKWFFGDMFLEVATMLNLNIPYLQELALNDKPIKEPQIEIWTESWWERKQRLNPDMSNRSYSQWRLSQKLAEQATIKVENIEWEPCSEPQAQQQNAQ